MSVETTCLKERLNPVTHPYSRKSFSHSESGIFQEQVMGHAAGDIGYGVVSPPENGR